MIDDNHKLDLMPGMVEAGMDVLKVEIDGVGEDHNVDVWRRILADTYRAMEQSRVYQIEMAQKRAADLGVEEKESEHA